MLQRNQFFYCYSRCKYDLVKSLTICLQENKCIIDRQLLYHPLFGLILPTVMPLDVHAPLRRMATMYKKQ